MRVPLAVRIGTHDLILQFGVRQIKYRSGHNRQSEVILKMSVKSSFNSHR